MATTRGNSRPTTISLDYLDRKELTRTETRIEIDAEDEKRRLTTHGPPTKDEPILTTKGEHVSTTDSFEQEIEAYVAPRTTAPSVTCERLALLLRM